MNFSHTTKMKWVPSLWVSAGSICSCCTAALLMTHHQTNSSTQCTAHHSNTVGILSTHMQASRSPGRLPLNMHRCLHPSPTQTNVPHPRLPTLSQGTRPRACSVMQATQAPGTKPHTSSAWESNTHRSIFVQKRRSSRAAATHHTRTQTHSISHVCTASYCPS